MEEEYLTIREAADFMHVQIQAVFAAMRRGKLPLKKMFVDIKKTRRSKTGEIKNYIDKREIYCVRKQDLDEYRKSKYVIEERRVDGERIYDLSKGNLSVSQVCRILIQMVGFSYYPSHFYYHIQKGNLPAYRVGGRYVIKYEDLQKFVEVQLGLSKVEQEAIS